MSTEGKIKLKFNDISMYRGELFGWAIISVVLLHYFAAVSGENIHGIAGYIAKVYNALIGSVGVDIFVFLSGLGIYYSLNKNKCIHQFYMKRVVRVIIPYLITGLIFWIIKDIVLQNTSLTRYFYDLSLISFWTEGVSTFWYIAFITVMYIISPLLFGMIDKDFAALVAVGIWILFSIMIYYCSSSFFEHTEIALLRVPQYILGMKAGKLANQNYGIKKTTIILLFTALPLKLFLNIINSPFERYGNLLYSILLIVLYIFFRKTVITGKLKVINYIGRYTLELYITHISTRNIIGTLGMNLARPDIYLAHIVVFIVLSYLLVLIQNNCTNKLLH